MVRQKSATTFESACFTLKRCSILSDEMLDAGNMRARLNDTVISESLPVRFRALFESAPSSYRVLTSLLVMVAVSDVYRGR
jgi:hypothetical protein